MPPALHAALTLALALGLAALAGLTVALWRRVGRLAARLERERPEPIPVASPPTTPLPSPAAAAVPITVTLPARPAGPPPRTRADATVPGDLGPTLIVVPNLATAPPLRDDESRASAADDDPRYAALWALADAGTPPAAIAARTGYPIGQVELILGLRRRRATPSGAGPHG